MLQNFPLSCKKTNRRRRGVALVEMAFVVVILLMLTMGLIQWGLIMNASISITNLSREGARFAAVHPDDDVAIEEYVKNNAPPGISSDDLDVTITPSGAKTAGNAVTVGVSYNMSKKLFMPRQAFGLNFYSSTYTAEGKMMVEG